jgi:hypothetical protein
LTIPIIAGHLLLDILFGFSLLTLSGGDRSRAEMLAVSALVGIYFETIFAAALLFLGFNLTRVGIAAAALMAVSIGTAIYRGRLQFAFPVMPWPRWYEWLLLVSIGEKLLFAGSQLLSTPVYFDDALTHWSGRARSLFGEINWSLDPTSPFFLGKWWIGDDTYPLLTVIWRTLTAKANGEWNDLIARADGVIFFTIVLATVWLAAWRISRERWLAAAAAFAVSAIPLQRWHQASGYSDIAVEAFVVAAVAALLRQDWLLSGVLAAGAVWSKNDGLLYFTAVLAGIAAMQWRKVPIFLAGFMTIAPWLIFNSVRLGSLPFRSETVPHPDAVMLFLNVLVNTPTSGNLWIWIFACLIYTVAVMFKDRTGRALLVIFVISFGGIAFVFTSTSAYTFLANQMTIHRALMQFSATAIVIALYGLSMKIRVLARAR